MHVTQVRQDFHTLCQRQHSDPTGLFDKMVFTLVMFGGNFLLYGAIGAIAGAAADRLHR